jgi:hypothetical protein
MPGRGDNNKHGSAGRGAGNQSNQRFVTDPGKQPASNHHKRSSDLSTFDLNVDDVPYVVEAQGFTFNDEERYNIRLNGGEQHVFTWDPQVRRFRSLDDDASNIPETVEEAISRKLESGRI